MHGPLVPIRLATAHGSKVTERIRHELLPNDQGGFASSHAVLLVRGDPGNVGDPFFCSALLS